MGIKLCVIYPLPSIHLPIIHYGSGDTWVGIGATVKNFDNSNSKYMS
jgi:hypothetical protein